jgi:formate dehydrogenase (NADP+) beta subunit
LHARGTSAKAPRAFRRVILARPKRRKTYLDRFRCVFVNRFLDNIRLNIDGKEIEVQNGATVLTAALGAGIYIPHLCHHPDLRPVGTCGLCVVDVEGMEEPCVSCTTPAADGMVVKTRTDRIERSRRQSMESLLVDHPSECLECSQYLHCELQSVKQYLGMTELLSVPRRSSPIPVNTSNPLFVHDFSRCIRCGRCVRACNELRGAGVLQMKEEGGETRISIPDGKSLSDAGCRFCGACVEVCPTGAMRDKEDLIKGKKRGAALVPCKHACPAEIDVPRYLRFICERRFAEAAAVIREKVPFPMVLGNVCHHPCEDVCRRAQVNEPVSIRDLKRFASEADHERLWAKNGRRNPPNGKRVAVVGAGPAGLTAAYYLSGLGHGVTVFEALPFAGGMMRFGIPEIRLPRDVLEREIREIEKAGVEIRTSARIEHLDGLMEEEGYDAVLVAAGAHRGHRLHIPGKDLDGVLVGLDFLREVNLGKKVEVGERVLVLGGGNVAIDCGRAALRAGAKEVHVVCLEKSDGMPAVPEEIEEGEKEGIVIHPSRTCSKILGETGRVTGVEWLEVESFSLDEDGKAQVDTVEGTEHIFQADTVIFAVGQSPDIPDGFDLRQDERHRVEVDPYTLETSRQSVFAAGDAVTGTSWVVQAIASGRKAAAALDRYLGGNGELDERLAPLEKPEPWLGPCEGFAGLTRARDWTDGFDERSAQAESSRCLRCDLRLRITPVKFWGEY